MKYGRNRSSAALQSSWTNTVALPTPIALNRSIRRFCRCKAVGSNLTLREHSRLRFTDGRDHRQERECSRNPERPAAVGSSLCGAKAPIEFTEIVGQRKPVDANVPSPPTRTCCNWGSSPSWRAVRRECCKRGSRFSEPDLSPLAATCPCLMPSFDLASSAARHF